LPDRASFRKLADRQKYAMLVFVHKRCEELERRLNLNSTNSSKPPSSDGPHVKRKPKEQPSGRKPGGQPGHKGNSRVPFTKDQLSEPTINVVPESCKHCAAPLKGGDPAPVCHQQIEIPPIVPTIKEYALHALKCGKCGRMTRAELPAGVAPGLMGPRLIAISTTLSGPFRMSKREVQTLLQALFSVKVGVALVTRSEKTMTTALAPVVDEAHLYTQVQAVGNMDETSWTERRKKAWLWTMVTPFVTIYKIHANRNGIAMKELLGKFSGVLGTDRYGAYNSIEKHQICWAHLKRDFEGFRAMRGKPGNIGIRLLATRKRIFGLWGMVKKGTLSRDQFRARLPYYKRIVENLLYEGANLPHGTVISGTCKRILKLKDSLWTFAEIEGVEPTNNAAERSIRPLVLWRKGSFGTHSEQGSRFVERISTVKETLRKQKRDLLEFLTQVSLAQVSPGVKLPSLLPLCG
jgi:transposase